MYEINYEDEQFQKVEAEKQAALNESNKMYDDMIAQSDKYYQDQIDANKGWTEKQTELQNEQTDFIIDTIEQQQKETEKDYIKEQKGAYVDWQKESNKYGANAEQMASSGLSGSGYAESSQVGMYNTYQNRVAVAREGFERAKTNYENNIKEAMLQNNAALAEIAYQGYINECQLLLQQFQYKNELLMAKSNAQTQITGRADTKYQAVLDQMNAENALREQIRQFDISQGVGTNLILDDDEEEENPSVTESKITVREAMDEKNLSILNERLKATGLPTIKFDEKFYVSNGKVYIKRGEDYIEIPARSALPNPSILGKGQLKTGLPVEEETNEPISTKPPEPYRVTMRDTIMNILYGDSWLTQKEYDDWYEKQYGVRPNWEESAREKGRG